MGYVLAICAILLAFALVIGATYGKSRAARRRLLAGSEEIKRQDAKAPR